MRRCDCSTHGSARISVKITSWSLLVHVSLLVMGNSLEFALGVGTSAQLISRGPMDRVRSGNYDQSGPAPSLPGNGDRSSSTSCSVVSNRTLEWPADLAPHNAMPYEYYMAMALLYTSEGRRLGVHWMPLWQSINHTTCTGTDLLLLNTLVIADPTSLSTRVWGHNSITSGDNLAWFIDSAGVLRFKTDLLTMELDHAMASFNFSSGACTDSVSGQKLSLDLSLKSLSEPVGTGPNVNGFWSYGMFQTSVPMLAAISGTVTVGNESLVVSGIAALSHQWGRSITSLPLQELLTRTGSERAAEHDRMHSDVHGTAATAALPCEDPASSTFGWHWLPCVLVVPTEEHRPGTYWAAELYAPTLPGSNQSAPLFDTSNVLLAITAPNGTVTRLSALDNYSFTVSQPVCSELDGILTTRSRTLTVGHPFNWNITATTMVPDTRLRLSPTKAVRIWEGMATVEGTIDVEQQRTPVTGFCNIEVFT